MFNRCEKEESTTERLMVQQEQNLFASCGPEAHGKGQGLVRVQVQCEMGTGWGAGWIRCRV
jgi:hypothetical protein